MSGCGRQDKTATTPPLIFIEICAFSGRIICPAVVVNIHKTHPEHLRGDGRRSKMMLHSYLGLWEEATPNGCHKDHL